MEFPKKIFMPFFVIGDPDSQTSIELIKTAIDNGAGALELGFAFSDPIADGPVIQRADIRALNGGITTEKAFDILKQIRVYSDIPISLMLSFNLVFKYGTEEFYKKCSELRIDGLLCPDVPLEESAELLENSKKYGVSQIFLVSPATTEERMKKIKEVCSGYVYLVSLLGTTGTRTSLNQTLPELIKKAKENFDLPIYVGFGISQPEHVKEVLNCSADGAICGSAICKLIEANLDNFEKMNAELALFCSSMAAAK